MVFSPELIALIAKLAAESGKSPEAYIADLVRAEDEERHSQWSPKKQAHVRVRCLREKCFEMAPRDLSTHD